jgi:hypothetical protein
MDKESDRISNRGNADQRKQRLLFDCAAGIFAGTRACVINLFTGMTRLTAHGLRGIAHRRPGSVREVRYLFGDSIRSAAELLLGRAILALNFTCRLVELPFSLQTGIPGQTASRVFYLSAGILGDALEFIFIHNRVLTKKIR